MNAFKTTRMLTTSEAARLLGVHAATVARWVADGRIAGMTTPGGHHRVPITAVEELRATLRVPKGPRKGSR